MCGSSLRTSHLSSQAVEITTTNHTSGVPHSIQALDAGVEFLLVFDDGDFSEDNTFLASQVFSHNPVRVPNPP